MASFGTVTFQTYLDQSGRLPALERESGVVEEQVPYAGASHFQFMKPGSPKLTLRISVESDWEWAALSAYLGDGVPRTLGDPFGLGTNLPNMCLSKLSGRRLGWAEDYEAEATFVQVAAS